MEFQLNMIPKPLPDICESAHECVAPHRNTHGKEPRVSSQPVIKVIRLPCSHPHAEIPTQWSTQAASRSQKRPANAQAPRKQNGFTPSNPDISHLKPIPYPTSNSAIRTFAPGTTVKRTSPNHLQTRQKHAFTSKRQHQCAKQFKVPSLPSNFSLVSSITEPSAKHQLRAPRAKLTSSSPMAHPEQKRPMSEKAAETVRVMEWTIAHVKAAEKRVREEERASYKEKEFVLRLRLWGAERKLRAMVEVENEEEESGQGNEQQEVKCPEKRIPQTIGQSSMGRYKTFVVKRRERCGVGLGIALER